MRTFRVATLNIWNRCGPWEERVVAIRDGLRKLAPDVMGLQEVMRFPDFDQAAVVSQGLGYEVAWGLASDHGGHSMGNAILSKWPILRTEIIPLPNGGSDERRSITFSELDSPYGKIPFFSTHLNWKLHHGHIRQEQVRALANAVLARAPITAFPPVIVGDFNAEPDSDEIRFMRGLTGLGGSCVYFADAFGVAGESVSGATFSKRNTFAEPLREPERRIDYIFVRGPDEAQRGEPLSASVCFDTRHAGVFPSDHFGVTATITAGR
ncbi:MAG: endonuclease/exonuclease/phosphatase family protein [Polyangiaceae bacterium]|nr:endonuclease/exonuclease/phosphatase family protein [Polyangiaceae bacterium]